MQSIKFGKNLVKVITSISIGLSTIVSPTAALAVTQPVSAPITIPVTIPILVAPAMVYPQDRQILDLEGAYMFKITQTPGASGYLFGLFQDGLMVYENYRDTQTLSPNGEFVLRESNPAHARFHAGAVTVMIRGLVNGQWTEAREITIMLRPRSTSLNPTPTITPIPTPIGIGTTNPIGIGRTNPASTPTIRQVITSKTPSTKVSTRSAIKPKFRSIILRAKRLFGK